MSLTPFFIDPFYSPSAVGHRHPRSDRSQNQSALQQLFSGVAVPAVDVYEEQEKFVVEAEVPGVKKEDLDIHIGDNGKSVTISGKTVSRRSWKTGTIEEDNSNAEKNTTANDKNGQAVQKKGDGQVSQTISSERLFVGDMAFSRTVWLPRPADATKVSAKLAEGVLTLCVPKLTDREAVRVSVE